MPRRWRTYTGVCWCDELLDPTDDPETGIRCRCLALPVRKRGKCSPCAAGRHLDTAGERIKAVEAVPA